VKALKTSGGGRTPVRHTIPLGIVIFLVLNIYNIVNTDFTIMGLGNIIAMKFCHCCRWFCTNAKVDIAYYTKSCLLTSRCESSGAFF